MTARGPANRIQQPSGPAHRYVELRRVHALRDLPEPLRRFRHPNDNRVARDPAPEIAFPADGSDLDLGIGIGEPQPLVVKVRNGAPPFTFYANGAPFEQSAFTRQGRWTPDGRGYVTVSVVDSEGRSDAVKVFLD